MAVMRLRLRMVTAKSTMSSYTRIYDFICVFTVTICNLLNKKSYSIIRMGA